MIAADKVDLPVPLGPMIACTSFCLIVRFTPFKISLPSISTCKSLISNTDTILMSSIYIKFSSYLVYNNFNLRSKAYDINHSFNYNVIENEYELNEIK